MMDDMTATDGTPARRPRNWARTATLLGGGVLAGAVLAGVATANAATTSPTPSSSSGTSSSSSSSSTTTPKGFDPGGSMPVRSDEKSVSSTLAATLTEKALAKVSGGTVIRVETDAGDAAYEVHVKKADGTLVTVTFDEDANITAVEDGMGKGDPAPAGAPAGAPPSSSSSTARG